MPTIKFQALLACLKSILFVDHSWMKDDICAEEPSRCEKQSCEEWDLGGGSFSALMTRSQDVSFGTVSPVVCDIESPTFRCRSSFSSFLVEPSSPCSVSDQFSFCSGGNSNVLEFSSPVYSMPSFAFFSHGPVTEEGCSALDLANNISSSNASHGGKLVSFP